MQDRRAGHAIAPNRRSEMLEAHRFASATDCGTGTAVYRPAARAGTSRYRTHSALGRLPAV